MKLVIDITEHEWKYLNKLMANGDQLGHYERLLVGGEPIQETKTDKYEYHIDHTDCIWYGSNGVYPNTCPNTCSQYRDGWNDAMEYIYKDGKGYQPYRRK